jgi:hypothetical protein
MVAVRTTAMLVETPIVAYSSGGSDLVCIDAAHLAFLSRHVNALFDANVTRVARFFGNLKAMSASMATRAPPAAISECVRRRRDDKRWKGSGGSGAGAGSGGGATATAAAAGSDAVAGTSGAGSGSGAGAAGAVRETSEAATRVVPSPVCTVCGLVFQSRNKLYAHVKGSAACQLPSAAPVVDDASAPAGRAASSPLPPSDSSDSKRDTSVAATSLPLSCTTCGLAFPSRNKLHAHVRSSAACQVTRATEPRATPLAGGVDAVGTGGGAGAGRSAESEGVGALQCSKCCWTAPSRNQLFKHIKAGRCPGVASSTAVVGSGSGGGGGGGSGRAARPAAGSGAGKLPAGRAHSASSLEWQAYGDECPRVTGHSVTSIPCPHQRVPASNCGGDVLVVFGGFEGLRCHARTSDVRVHCASAAEGSWRGLLSTL